MSNATVIIVNYNGAHLLPACLDGLAAQTDAAPFDTVVVDNASSDGSVELLARDYPWVRVLASPVNTGFAGGNNLALETVTTPFAVLLNNDAVPQPGWLRTLLAGFDGPDGDQLGAVTGKILFLPRFVPISFATEGFRPGPHDTRDLGVRVYRVRVGGTDVTAKIMWESAAYGPEGSGEGQYRWTRPAGEILVPVPASSAGPDGLITALDLELELATEKPATIRINDTEHEVGPQRATVTIALPAGTPAVDVVNNVGGVVFAGGYGADRGFQQIDRGQFDVAEDVFTACGNGVALRVAAAAPLGWFDDDFFMYYEDTDLSWRLRSRGWRIRYEPGAVLRHIHAASSKEWSPRFVFHVDRNRLLMLTKDASWSLAGPAVARYPVTTASMLLRAAIETLRTRRRPALRSHWIRVRVMASYLRLAPRMLARRWRVGRRAEVTREDLELWLVTPE